MIYIYISSLYIYISFLYIYIYIYKRMKCVFTGNSSSSIHSSINGDIMFYNIVRTLSNRRQILYLYSYDFFSSVFGVVIAFVPWLFVVE